VNISSIHTAFYFAPYIQYSIVFILFVLFFMHSPRSLLRKGDVVIYSIMFILCIISYLNGISMEMSTNFKPFIITILLVFLNSRLLPVHLLKYFLFILLAFLAIEYLVAYTQLITTFHSNYVRIFGLIRPVGLFLDLHMTAYTIVFSIFILGYFKLTGFIAIFFGSYQIVIGWFILALSKLNLIYIFTSLLCIVFILYSVDHLTTGENSESMLSVILNISDYEFSYKCLILGCSVNIDSLSLSSGVGNKDSISDFGYFRILYQFGLLWAILLLFSLRRYNKFFIAANIVMCIHYPVTFGILGFTIFIYFLHCLKYKEYIEVNKS